jgi:integrase
MGRRTGVKSNQLSTRKVALATQPGYYGDGGGLYLQVSERYKARSWVFRFTLAGRTREMGLGSLSTFTLSEARTRAHKCRQLLADGIDPIEDRRSRRERVPTALFKDAAELYLKVHAPTWKNPTTHCKTWRSSLAKYAYPSLASRPVETITGAVVTETLAPIWTKMPAAARQVKQRVTAICEWVRLGQPVPQEKANKNTQHHAAMSYGAVPTFMDTLRKVDTQAARALEFTILNAVRVSDTCGMLWDEVDLDAGTWTIRDGRHKSGKDFVVPLSTAAIAIIKSQPRDNDRVFGVNRRTVSRLLEGMGYKGEATVHGFRSSFRDWAGDQTNFAREVIEEAMSHQIKNATEAAYRRSSAIEKRRTLMDAWTTFLIHD